MQASGFSSYVRLPTSNHFFTNTHFDNSGGTRNNTFSMATINTSLVAGCAYIFQVDTAIGSSLSFQTCSFDRNTQSGDALTPGLPTYVDAPFQTYGLSIQHRCTQTCATC